MIETTDRTRLLGTKFRRPCPSFLSLSVLLQGVIDCVVSHPYVLPAPSTPARLDLHSVVSKTPPSIDDSRTGSVRPTRSNSGFFDIDSGLRKEVAICLLSSMCHAVSRDESSGDWQGFDSASESSLGTAPLEHALMDNRVSELQLSSTSHAVSVTSYASHCFVRLRRMSRISAADVRVTWSSVLLGLVCSREWGPPREWSFT